MGDVSIIARRLSPKYVQYGWSGNGGYFISVGGRLLEWYNTKDDDLIDYLFSLGQFSHLGQPGSEKGGFHPYYTHELTKSNHYIGTSEIDIFSKIICVDFGYFYDLDKEWYYIYNGHFKFKIPLEVISHHLDDQSFEFEYIVQLQKRLIKYIFGDYCYQDETFVNLLKINDIDATALKNILIAEKHPISCLCDNHRKIFNYFDDWILAIPNKNKDDIDKFVIRPMSDKHIETLYWQS